MIKITDKAKDYLTKTAINQDKPYVRFSVKGGGCAGFQYGLDFDENGRDGDFELEFDGLKVWVDPMSAMHLEGTVIDYVMGISGAGFKFNNPNAKTTCGCGSSFS